MHGWHKDKKNYSLACANNWKFLLLDPWMDALDIDLFNPHESIGHWSIQSSWIHSKVEAVKTYQKFASLFGGSVISTNFAKMGFPILKSFYSNLYTG